MPGRKTKNSATSASKKNVENLIAVRENELSANMTETRTRRFHGAERKGDA